MRKSKSGVEIEELPNPSVLIITTNCPNKYLLLDRETGKVYQGQNPGKGKKQWKLVDRLTHNYIKELEVNIR